MLIFGTIVTIALSAMPLEAKFYSCKPKGKVVRVMPSHDVKDGIRYEVHLMGCKSDSDRNAFNYDEQWFEEADLTPVK